ncbi:outer membrane protein [Bartonella tamiae]|uniref:Outer membrane protein beta-barrel domain-containing protein n=1 Tax=Bartonella tamiae Th239 TaxID=1094558 RepID=J1K2L3_9HYPH|nr:outer membrane beta-barrel protein [Bartonella tamiae]EJF91727.1 hypothetical protein ME5_00106 [Bartonella tamiae Th239]EJF92605.1 hypothetical protein MEG_01775 [Bartonella tamiae Th307]
MTIKRGLLAFFLTSMSCYTYASDIDLNNVPELKFTEQSGKFYTKAYIGGAFSSISRLSHLRQKDDFSPYFWKNRGDIKDTFLGGIGLGYALNDLLRLDATIDYRRKNKLRGRDVNGIDVRRYSGDVSSLVLMTNVYVDLLTISKMTPYLGAGLGAVSHHVSGFSVKTHDSLKTSQSHTKWDFAWALHAGVGIALNEKLILDVGYSYNDLGQAKTGEFGDFDTITLNHLTSHDVKIGFRYAF